MLMSQVWRTMYPRIHQRFHKLVGLLPLRQRHKLLTLPGRLEIMCLAHQNVIISLTGHITTAVATTVAAVTDIKLCNIILTIRWCNSFITSISSNNRLSWNQIRDIRPDGIHTSVRRQATIGNTIPLTTATVMFKIHLQREVHVKSTMLFTILTTMLLDRQLCVLCDQDLWKTSLQRFCMYLEESKKDCMLFILVIGVT